MNRKGLTLVEMWPILAIGAVLLVIFFPHGQKAPAAEATPLDRLANYYAKDGLNSRHHLRQKGCLENVKLLQLAMVSYAQDYDERLPVVSSNTTDSLWPYLKEDKALVCPLELNGLSYALSDNVVGNSYDTLNKIAEPSETPTTWEFSYDKQTFSATRHNNGSNLGFLDGHAKWWPAKDQTEVDDHGIRHLRRPGTLRMSQGLRMYTIAPELPTQ